MADRVRHLLYVDHRLPTGVEERFADRCVLCGPETDNVGGAVGIIAGTVRWDPSRLNGIPKARVLSRSGIGYDNIDVPAATARGIVVCVAADAPTVSTAEHTMALILAAAKRLVPNQTRLRSGSGDYFTTNQGIELAGRTLGLVGYGRIARRVRRAAEALDMEVIAYDPYLSTADVAGVELVGFAELLRRADVISVHTPLTAETRRMFDFEAFAAMRRGCVFVNAARGGLVDHVALLEAVDTGQVRMAALDVTDPEPLPPESPLLHHDDILITPHVASSTDTGRVRLYEHAVDNAIAVLEGRPRHVVNPEVLAQRP